MVADVADVLMGEAPAHPDQILQLEDCHILVHVPAVTLLLEHLGLGVAKMNRSHLYTALYTS